MTDADREHWQQVKAVFEGAIALQGIERVEFLDRACGSASAVRTEVDSLLRSYSEAESFMETPAVVSAAESLVGQQKKLKPGERVKHYEIVRAIGAGGMGEVYLARDSSLERQVALKVLPEYVSKDPDRLKRFKQEARAASALNHPNVCVIHEIGETADARPFIAMEYIEGETLRQRIEQHTLTLGEAIDIAIQVADALHVAHESGIVHRDIKPENIMIRRDGYVKVFDFGLAKLTERKHSGSSPTLSTLLANSSPGTVMGTAAYMSPEQARGVAVDKRTDIWSLGVVLYEMICGLPPFVGETPTDVVVGIVERDPPSISDCLPNAPGELERIVRKALRKHQDERYQITKEIAIDLRSLRKELERESQLDRSLAPGVHTTASGRKLGSTDERKIDTHQLEAHRLTALHPAAASSRRRWRFAFALTGVLMLLVAAFGIYRVLRRTEKVPDHFQRTSVNKLTTNGNAMFASISPEGKYVAYVRSENGKESLWLRQVGTAGNLEVVPPREGHYLGLAFSPDGNFIYYGYTTSGVSESAVEIYKLPVLGTGALAVKVNPEESFGGRSHDGKHIAFIRRSREKETDTLLLANNDGSGEQVLATRKWPDRFGWDLATTPAWSDDDQSLSLPLVNSDATGFYFTIYEFRLSDRTEKILPVSPAHFEQPNYVNLVSDASAVILSGRAQGASFEQIWYLSRDGSARSLTNDLSDYRGVVLTANAKLLVATQTQTLANIWTGKQGDLNKATQVTSGLGRYFDLSWAPDGKIIYASDASGSADIFEIGANGQNIRQLTSGVKRNYAPAVSPDNRFIVFHSNRSGVFQIWRMDRDGSHQLQLTFGNSESHWPQVSADGKFVIYQHFEPGVSSTLWRVPIEGGTATRVTDGFAARPTLSPDGKWLSYWYNDGQPSTPWRLGLFSLESGKQERTFDLPPSVIVGWNTLLRWNSDSKGLAFVDSRGGFQNIWIQTIDGQPAKQLTDFRDKDIFSFDFARDGTLAISKGVITSDVVLIEDVEAKP